MTDEMGALDLMRLEGICKMLLENLETDELENKFQIAQFFTHLHLQITMILLISCIKADMDCLVRHGLSACKHENPYAHRNLLQAGFAR